MRLLVIFLLIIGLSGAIFTSGVTYNKPNNISATDSTEYYKHKIAVLQEAYKIAILDPCVRLKMVVGIPEEEAITWKQKVIHDINTKALTRWRPDSLHHYYDEETGTWNKPSSYH